MRMEKKNAKRRRRLMIVGIVMGVVLILGVTVGVIAAKNVKAMNDTVDAVLEELKARYALSPLDAGEYEEIKIYGIMKFKAQQYEVEGLGNLSVMRMNMGVMQMATVVLTPKEKNMPLVSADYIYVLGNRKAYLEFYDVVKEKDETYNELTAALSDVIKNYDHLENFEAKEAWYDHLLTVDAYKSVKAKNDGEIKNLLTDSLKVYLDHSQTLPQLSSEEREEKIAITQAYTDGLVEKGGVSTDVFKKELGVKETKKFFDKVFFGTKAE